MSYPILYSATETDFSNNGLGILGDCVSCEVTEEANGIFELAMQYPMSGIHYEDIVDRSIIKSKADQFREPQLFRVYAISKPMSGIVTVLAEHISYDLSGIPVSPFSAQSAPAALSGLKSNAVVDCPFELWTDKDTSGEFRVPVPSSIRSRLGGITGSVLDVYGGEFEFDNYTVKLHNNRGMNRGVSIRYGKNLTDIKQEQNCASIATGIYPYWAGNVDGSTVLVELPEKIINAPGTYNFVRIRTLDLSSEFEEQPTVDQLRAKAKNYVESNNIGVPTVSLSVSFAQLEQSEEYKGLKLLERVSLFDTVNVEFPALGVSSTAKAVKLIYDALADRVKSITLGSVKSNIADTIVEQQKEIEKAPTKTELERAKEAATAWLTNGKGYAYFRKDDLGNIVDILFMDTQDTSTAINVMRVGQSGIGFSHDGVNGPFESAWTIDGNFVADFITTGTLNAALIKAGVLQDKTGKVFSLDLDGGTLDANFNSLKISGRSTEEISNDIASDVTDGKLAAYSTTVQMNSAIEQSASSIKLEVSENYATTVYVDSAMTSAVDEANNATNGKLKEYSTTEETKSLISQSADQITLEVSKTYATQKAVKTEVDSLKQQAANAQSAADVAAQEASTAKSNAAAASKAAANAQSAADAAAQAAAAAEENAAADAAEKAAAAQAAAEAAAAADATAKAAAAEAAAKEAAAEDAAEKAAAAQSAANSYTDGKLTAYSTTVQMQSAIDQSASSIKLEVSETYSTKEYVDNAKDSAVDTANSATDGKLEAYSTTVQMQSAIEQSAKKISLSVTNNGTSSVLTLSYDGTTLSSQNVEISGFVTFSSLSTSGQSTINGDNITTGTISANIASVSSSAGTVKIQSGGLYAYDANGTYRIGLFTASSTNNALLKFKDSGGNWCGDLFGYRDNDIGIVQLNLSQNGFFRTSRIQTSEIAIGNMKCFCDGYKALNGSAFVYLDGTSRVGCFEKLAIGGSAAYTVEWVWDSALGRNVLCR